MNNFSNAKGKSLRGGMKGHLVLAALLSLIVCVGHAPPVESSDATPVLARRKAGHLQPLLACVRSNPGRSCCL